MREIIQYTPDEVFTKMTKKQKLQLPEYSGFSEEEIDKIVIVPISRKMSGYCMGSFFAHTPKKGWWRPHSYDCWRITTEIENPVTPRYTLLQGDFENGGVQIFTLVDEHCTAYMRYGGEVIIKRKPSSLLTTN